MMKSGKDYASSLLPILREDLKIHRAGRNIWGVPVWVIEDPVRNQFFKIDQRGFEVLIRLGRVGALDDLKTILNQETVGDWTDEVIIEFLNHLSSMDLIQKSEFGSGRDYKQKKEAAAQVGGLVKRVQKSLFMMLPLIRPDRFLDQTKSRVSFLYQRWFFYCLLFLSGLDIFLLNREWTSFKTGLINLVSIDAVPGLLFSIVFVKILHEFSHAYAARLNGVRVGSMGVALMFFYPVLYTEATGIWRLSDKRKRCLINGAGLLAEWALATFSLLIWLSLDDGAIKQIMFFLATVSLISSVLVNSNPFMKFDGYYLLADYWGIDNMMQRGLLQARDHLRRFLWGWEEEKDSSLPERDRKLLTLYGYGVWLYRIVLYGGLAALISIFLDPPVSIWLGGGVILLFLVRPVIIEIMEWIKTMRDNVQNRKPLRVFVYGALVLFVLFVPFFSKVTIEAVLYPAQNWTAYAPFPAELKTLQIKPNQNVEKGQILAVLEEPDIERQYQKALQNLKAVISQKDREAIDIFLSRRSQIKNKEVDQAIQEVKKFETRLNGLTLRAPFDGQAVFVVSCSYQEQWVSQEQPLIQIVQPQNFVVEGYARIDEFERLKDIKTGVFYPRRPDGSIIPVRVDLIEETAGRSLPFLSLSRIGGGSLDVDARRPQTANYPLYKIRAVVEGDEANLSDSTWLYREPGELVIKGERQSLAFVLYRMIGRLIRLGF